MAQDRHTWQMTKGDKRLFTITIEDPDTGAGMDLSTGWNLPKLIITDEKDGERLVDGVDMVAVDAATGQFSFLLDTSSFTKSLVRGRWRTQLVMTDDSEDFVTVPWEFILLPLEGT